MNIGEAIQQHAFTVLGKIILKVELTTKNIGKMKIFSDMQNTHACKIKVLHQIKRKYHKKNELRYKWQVHMKKYKWGRLGGLGG